MLRGPLRLSILAAILAFGATGMALALTGAGVPFLLAALLAAGCAGGVQYAALRQQPPPDRTSELAQAAKLEEFRSASSLLRHDIRGVLSPALMMTDRLVRHPDPAVQRAGQAVIRSIERATDLLATNRDTLAP